MTLGFNHDLLLRHRLRLRARQLDDSGWWVFGILDRGDVVTRTSYYAPKLEDATAAVLEAFGVIPRRCA